MGDVIQLQPPRLPPAEAFEKMDTALTRAAVLLGMMQQGVVSPEEMTEPFGDEVQAALSAWSDLTMDGGAMDRIRSSLAPQIGGAA